MDWVVDIAMVVGTLLMIAIGMTIYTRLNPTRPKVGPDHYIYTGIIPTITISEDSPVKLSPKVRTPADSDEEEEESTQSYEAKKIEYPKNTRLSVPEEEDDEEEETAQVKGVDQQVLKELKLLEEINQAAKRKDKHKGEGEQEESESKKSVVIEEDGVKGVEKKPCIEEEDNRITIEEEGLQKDVLEKLEVHSFEESIQYSGDEDKHTSLKGVEKKHCVEEEDNRIKIEEEDLDVLKRLYVHSFEESEQCGGEEDKHIDVGKSLEGNHKVFEEVTQSIIEEKGSDEDILKRLAKKHYFLREDEKEPQTRNIGTEENTNSEKPEHKHKGGEEEQLTQPVSASISTKKDDYDRHSPVQEVASSHFEEDTETDEDILRRLMEKHSFLLEGDEAPSGDVDLSREVLKKALLGQVNMGFSFGSEGVPESCALVSDLLDDNLNLEKPTDVQRFIAQLDEHHGDEEDDGLPDLLPDEEESSDSVSLAEDDFLLEAPIPVFEENIVFVDDRYLDRDGFVHLPRVNICGSKIGTSHTVEEPLFPFNEILKEEELAQKVHVKKRLSH